MIKEFMEHWNLTACKNCKDRKTCDFDQYPRIICFKCPTDPWNEYQIFEAIDLIGEILNGTLDQNIYKTSAKVYTDQIISNKRVQIRRNQPAFSEPWFQWITSKELRSIFVKININRKILCETKQQSIKYELKRQKWYT